MQEPTHRIVTDGEQAATHQRLDKPFGAYAPTSLQKAIIALARNTPLHHGRMRHKLSDLIYKMGRPLDITRRGCNYRVGVHPNLIEYGLMLHPTYNQPDIEFLAEGLGAGAVIVDIGSNIGLYSAPLARTGARVISIDANPAMAAQLRFNLAASNLPTEDIVTMAVGDHDGTIHLEIHKSDVAIVKVVENAKGNLPVQRLTRILQERGVTRVDALKIDIEGHEDKALAPYLDSVSGDMIPRRIVIERVGPEDYPGCAAAFARLGYTEVGRSKQNTFYQLGA